MLISAIVGIATWILQALSLVILVYCVMTLVVPQNELVRKAGAYIEPMLAPFRSLLHRIFPKLRGFAFDLSPLVMWLVIDIAIWLLRLLSRILP